MSRSVILARVSTEEQAQSGFSLNEQLSACRQKAKELNAAIVKEISLDHTGATFDRPDIDEIMDLARAGKIDIVITMDPDRWGRTLVDQLVTESEGAS